MMWLAAGVFTWLASLVGVLGLCRAAAEGDRALHAHNPRLDDDQAWDDLVRRLEGPTTWCATCGEPTEPDALWCGPECQGVWLA